MKEGIGPMRRMALSLLACIAALLFLAPVRPATALAIDGSYSIDELSTSVTVQADASVHIVERQVLTFADRPAGVVWYLHVPSDGESVRINSVRVAPVDNGGMPLADWTRLQMVDSKPREQGREPGDTAAPSLRAKGVQPWYSYNMGDGMMRCYFPAVSLEDEAADGQSAHTYAIETDYVIAHHVRTYRDVGELYWRYVNDSLPAAAENVTLQVTLPVPAEADLVTAMQDVEAWGHGPDEGSFSVNDDGTVTYRISRVEEGNYAEAHLIFPASWLSAVAPGAANQYSELRRADAVAEETAWVDRGLRGAAWDNKVRMLFLVIAVAVIVLGGVGVVRHGRSALAHRALVRTAATLGIIALAENLFFHEPLTTAILAGLALVVAVISFMLPTTSAAEDDEQGPEESTMA